ncbi:MAG: hypothetical protein WC728_07130 [Elusimicrobiota bacterium]
MIAEYVCALNKNHKSSHGSLQTPPPQCCGQPMVLDQTAPPPPPPAELKPQKSRRK